ncbi:MAG TPA: hypothetical protein VLT36_02155 [Candidatus Dormibacteraeota bacterium]|nr:hypothetical protein [Candidatus Dormibacteraeota bacterium]
MQAGNGYQLIVLDKPPYVVMVIMFGFLSAYIVWYFAHRLRVRHPKEPTKLIRGAELLQRSNWQGPSAFVCLLIAAFMLWLGRTLYREFVAVEFRADRILLHYPWPRPPKSVLKDDIKEVRIVRAKRKRFLGAYYMEIETRHGTFSTDRLPGLSDAKIVKDILEK